MSSATVFLAALFLYLRTSAPSIASGDTAELLLAGLDLDVAHAPGYPLMAMLVRLALSLPVGGLATRAGLVPAFAGAGACTILFGLVRRITGRRLAGLFAAGLFAVSPLAWEQSGMLEKYAIQLLLAAWCLRLMVGGTASWLSGAFGLALALGHHPMAVFLVPVLVPFAWRRLRGTPGAPRAVMVAAVLGLLPLSLRPLYAAVRADALRRAESGGERVINWYEPARFRAWRDYMTLAPYASRFERGTRTEVPAFRGHLAVWPAQLGWTGLLLAALGLAWLLARSRPEALGLAGVFAISFPFNLRYLNPPALVAVYHQTELLVLALLAGLGAGAALALLRRPAVEAAVSAVAAGWLGTSAHHRAPVCDASRQYLVFDFNAAQIASAPRGAVLMAAGNLDRNALPWLQSAMGRREDLVPVVLPNRWGVRRFETRARFRTWMAGLLPDAALNFTDDDSGAVILRRLVEGNRARYCFAGSGLSPVYLSPDLFAPAGLLELGREGRCPGAPDPESRALRRASSRSWFAASSRVPVNRPALDCWSLAFDRAAAAATGKETRLALLRTRTRMSPDDPAAWEGFAVALAGSGRRAEAEACYRRALAVDPGSIEARVALVRLSLDRGDPAAAAAVLHEAFAVSALRSAPGAARVLASLAAGRLDEAAADARRVFAASALDRALGAPATVEYEYRRLSLVRLAADLAPEWKEAQAACAAMLTARGRAREAAVYLERLGRQDGRGD